MNSEVPTLSGFYSTIEGVLALHYFIPHTLNGRLYPSRLRCDFNHHVREQLDGALPVILCHTRLRIRPNDMHVPRALMFNARLLKEWADRTHDFVAIMTS